MFTRLFSMIAACVLSASVFAQQVPNGNFETWIATPFFTLDPEFWSTDNGQVIVSTLQDSMPYEGEWAMRVLPIPIGVGEEGRATVQIPTDYIPEALDFYAKWERTATAGLGVTVTFYNDAELVYSEYWWPEELSSEWTPISIELNQIEPVMTHVIIEVGVYIGDFAAGDGWISVDAMSFDGVTGVDDLSAPSFGLYPNPAKDVLYIDEADSKTTYSIYDAMGKLLIQDLYEEGVDVSTLPTGRYFIEALSVDGLIRRTGFVVE